jgi:hypothetical protein
MNKSFLDLLFDGLDSLSNYAEAIKDAKKSGNGFGGYVKDDNGRISYKTFDVTNYKGYSEYMKYLADLKNQYNSLEASNHDTFKTIFGEYFDVNELFDTMAKKATEVYNEAGHKNAPVSNEDNKQSNTTTPNPLTNVNKQADGKYKINKCCDCGSVPSDFVDDDKYEHICNIVTKYFDEEFVPSVEDCGTEISESTYDFIFNELIEFACWLSNRK